MVTKWTDKFLYMVESDGLDCHVLHRERDWLETLLVNGQRCYCKSKTYDQAKREYYIGVDPKKLREEADFALICGGGSNDQFRDIFLIPWAIFIQTLSAGDPKNTYRLPRVYVQYRFYLRDRSSHWVMSVQPAGRRELDITQWRCSADEAIAVLKEKE